MGSEDDIGWMGEQTSVTNAWGTEGLKIFCMKSMRIYGVSSLVFLKSLSKLQIAPGGKACRK